MEALVKRIVLIMDRCETSQKSDILSYRKLREMKLREKGVVYEVRSLKTGDFMWIARERKAPYRELVLDCLVERKRMDDLYYSKRDGR